MSVRVTGTLTRGGAGAQRPRPDTFFPIMTVPAAIVKRLLGKCVTFSSRFSRADKRTKSRQKSGETQGFSRMLSWFETRN